MPSSWLPISDPVGSPPPAPIPDAERAPSGALLFEVSWEVCNQLGGIYQVIRSKAARMVNRWRNRYFLVGPYVEARANLEFEERKVTPASGWLAATLGELEGEGLKVRHGRWLVPGRPRTLLIEYGSAYPRIDALKFELWEKFAISSPTGDWYIDQTILFGDAVRRLIQSACKHSMAMGTLSQQDDEHDDGDEHTPELAALPAAVAATRHRRVLAHMHEWMAGLAIPFLRQQHTPVATAFTTHATLLGRYLASGDDKFYDHLPFVNAGAEAARFNIPTQHGIESLCAQTAHVFTTVSPITGEECSALLGRKPDLVLPNALNIDTYNVGHEFQTMHAQYKERIHRFVMGHFFPSYSFDLDKTIYMFTSGRFEPRNKGFDLCLEAMARLNAELKTADLGVTVVFFIISAQPVKSLHPAALQQRGVLREMREVCQRITNDVGEAMFRKAAAGERFKLDELVPEYWSLRFRRVQQAMRNDNLPMVVTHLLRHESTDPVLNQIRNLWLHNRPEDPVKVVYHPEFINPTNPLWGIDYDQFVRGCHMGVFPSAYEPWGYTPLECLAMGVPSVTSDLAGYGRYIQETHPDFGPWGAHVLRRRGRSYNEAAHDLSQHLLKFCKLSRRERIQVRNDVERRSWDFDWSRLGRAYDWAHDLAMARAGATH